MLSTLVDDRRRRDKGVKNEEKKEVDESGLSELRNQTKGDMDWLIDLLITFLA